MLGLCYAKYTVNNWQHFFRHTKMEKIAITRIVFAGKISLNAFAAGFAPHLHSSPLDAFRLVQHLGSWRLRRLYTAQKGDK